MKLLESKRGLIVGVANKRSIAWAIAQSAASHGASLAFTYQSDRLKENVEELVATLPGEHLVLPCDLTIDDQLSNVCQTLESKWGSLDFAAHCVAFAHSDDLGGEYAKTSKEGFDTALGVSAYTFTKMSQKLTPLMEKAGGGSLVTLSYYGAQKVVLGYNIMGVAKAALESSVRYLAYDLGQKNIRVNAISAGPINTLAARGIAGFTDILKIAREKAPLKRNTEAAEVGDAATFLFSSMSRGVTGEILFVDNGLSTVGF